MRYAYMDKPVYDASTHRIVPDYRIDGDTFVAAWRVEPLSDEAGYMPTPEEQPDCSPTLRERIEALEAHQDVADMAYINSEIALAMVKGMEV